MDELERKVGIPLRTMAWYLHVVVIEVDEEFLDLDKLPGKLRIACWARMDKFGSGMPRDERITRS